MRSSSFVETTTHDPKSSLGQHKRSLSGIDERDGKYNNGDKQVGQREEGMGPRSRQEPM